MSFLTSIIDFFKSIFSKTSGVSCSPKSEEKSSATQASTTETPKHPARDIDGRPIGEGKVVGIFSKWERYGPKDKYEEITTGEAPPDVVVMVATAKHNGTADTGTVVFTLSVDGDLFEEDRSMDTTLLGPEDTEESPKRVTLRYPNYKDPYQLIGTHIVGVHQGYVGKSSSGTKREADKYFKVDEYVVKFVA